MSGVAGIALSRTRFRAHDTGNGVLILSGWVDWADGSTFLGVAQQGKGGLVPPYLQVRDERARGGPSSRTWACPQGNPRPSRSTLGQVAVRLARGSDRYESVRLLG